MSAASSFRPTLYNAVRMRREGDGPPPPPAPAASRLSGLRPPSPHEAKQLPRTHRASLALKRMRFVTIILLCLPLILSESTDDIHENEIPVDESLEKQEQEGPIESESSDEEVDNDDLIESTSKDDLTLEEAYKKSVDAYLDENWDECIEGFKKAIASYKRYKKAVIKCRRECREQSAGFEPIFPENVDDLHFYEKKVRETLCLLTCNQDYRDQAGDQALKRIPKDVESKYIQRNTYEYLHICYYQKNRFQEAANAMYTYLVIHPKHELSVKNLRHYLSLPEVDESKVINLESELFVKKYISGVAAYNDHIYLDAVNRLEASLQTYLKSEEDCRFYCEGYFNQGWLPDFIPSIANHFTYSLKCKRSCSQWLNNINGEYHKDLLQSHYHYLQFAYYKLGDVKSACAAVESYLLFQPSDETMLQNKDYFSKLPKVEEDYFTPREEALKYVKRQEYELRLLLSISEEFATVDARLKAATKLSEEKDRRNTEEQLVDHPPPGHSPAFHLRLPSNKTWEEENKLHNVNSSGESVTVGKEIRVVADEDELGGKLRYVAEGFLNKSGCESLIRLAQLGAVEGDGYEGNVSPHSTYEKFEGLTLGRAALMVYFGLLDPDTLEHALKITEDARDHVARYFNLDRHLYFTYTHLACRSALPDSPTDRQDLSHAIHADNCMVADDGSCAAEWPAYTFRDYSAIIYLNDDFEGGEFVFTADNKARKVQSTVEPRCGKLVAFEASGINLHGVRGVLRGKRCALGLWFTFDEEHLEVERNVARAVIERVRTLGIVTPKSNESAIATDYEDTLSDQFDLDDKLNYLYQSLRSP